MAEHDQEGRDDAGRRSAEAPPTPATSTGVKPEHDASGSLAPGYFDQLYAEHGDPWSFATSAYEAAKYRETLRALPRPRYQNALEVGCSVGVLTRLLSTRCERLLAVDVSLAALEGAAARCSGRPVLFERRTLPDEMPEGPFDLVVLSEVGYYWSADALSAARAAFRLETKPGAHLLLVHYTGQTNYPLKAHDVHEAFGVDPAWRHVAGSIGSSYRLDVLERE